MMAWSFHLQSIVEQARAILETIDGVSSVHGRFYELCSNYHKVSWEITFSLVIVMISTNCICLHICCTLFYKELHPKVGVWPICTKALS